MDLEKTNEFKYPLVHVVWDDASVEGGWDDIQEVKPSLATTVGFLVRETDDHIVIASTYDENYTNARIQIPRGMIQTIREIFPKKEDKPKVIA